MRRLMVGKRTSGCWGQTGKRKTFEEDKYRRSGCEKVDLLYRQLARQGIQREGFSSYFVIL